MSSTDTEVSPGRICHVRPKKKAKAKRGSKAPITMKSGTAVGKNFRNDDFEMLFWKKVNIARRSYRGCVFCNFKCFETAESCIDGIKKWRVNFRTLSSEVADREIRWIFSVCRRKSSFQQSHVVEKVDEEGLSTDTSRSSCQMEKQRSLPACELEDALRAPSRSPSSTSTSHFERSDDEPLDLQGEKPSILTPASTRIGQSSHGGKNSSRAPSVHLHKFIASANSTSDDDGFVCLKAARFLLGIGDHRLQRVMEERPDRRCGPQPAHMVPSRQLLTCIICFEQKSFTGNVCFISNMFKFSLGRSTQPRFEVCNSFLQIKYHCDGEFLPDRFEFDTMSQFVDGQMLPSERKAQAAGSDSEETLDSHDDGLKEQGDPDDQERALSAMAIGAITLNEPFRNAQVGPGQSPGPRRYLGVVKPVVLYESMVIWCHENNHVPPPSFTTFRRALKAARPWIRFRKAAGQHGLCDHCMFFKSELKKFHTSETRANILDQYAKHLLQNYRDRQFDAALHSQACQTRADSLSGNQMSSMSHSAP